MLEMIGYLAIVKLVKFPLLQDPSNLLNANNFLEVWNKHGNNIEKQINDAVDNLVIGIMSKPLGRRLFRKTTQNQRKPVKPESYWPFKNQSGL